MKKLILFSTIYISLNGFGQTYPSYNISLLGISSPETTNNWYATGTKYAGCFGWHNPADDREYAILGTTKGNYFIEVTDPANPVVRDFVAGASQNSLWREIQTYQNYAYMVSDDTGSELQIADMSYLPDSVHVVYSSNALFSRAHTLFVEGDKLYCGGVTLVNSSGFYPMAVYDISNPVNPVFLRALNQDYPSVNYVHDMHVKNDTVYASTGNPGLNIFKLNSNNTFTLLADYTNYLQAGYNHSSYLSPDSKTLVFTDEIPTGLAVKVLDVSDLSNLTLTDTIVSHPGATAHNPYITNDYHVVLSYYQDGVYIYDISNPSSAVLSGYFDTDPLHGDNDNYATPQGYRGCWGAYPFLPSGILLASDMQNGLFILDVSAALSIQKGGASENTISIYPNPADEFINLHITGNNFTTFDVSVFDITGKILLNNSYARSASLFNQKIDISDLAAGSYLIKVHNNENVFVSKLLITK